MAKHAVPRMALGANEGNHALAREARLNSWKEIAAYLHRGVTTVQRWEKDEALPVHRLQHQKGGSIFAYRQELDTWWQDRQETLDSETRQNLPHIARRPWMAWAGGVALVLVGASLGFISGSKRAPALASNAGSKPTPTNICPHPANLGSDRITALTEFQGQLYAAVHRPAGGGGWAIQIIDPRTGKRKTIYRSEAHVERLVPTFAGMYTVLYWPKVQMWEIWHGEYGDDVVDGVVSHRVYRGDARVDALLPYENHAKRHREIIAAFSGSKKDDPCGIYSVGETFAGGSWERRYTGRKRVELMTTFRGGLLTALAYEETGRPGGVYLSTDGMYPGNVTTTTSVSADSEVAHVDALVEIQPGVLVSFYNPINKKPWGIYLTRSGMAAGSETRAYVGEGRVDAMLAYREGVITAFYDYLTGAAMGAYYSPDRLNLGGGPNTVYLYNGGLRVGVLARSGEGVVAAFFDPKTGDGAGVSYSEDGRSLLAGDTRTSARPPLKTESSPRE